MFSNPPWVRLAATLNLFGAFFVFLSFQAASSQIQVISAANGEMGLCIGHTSIYANHSIYGATSGCPQALSGHSIAIVSVEHPLLGYLGFGMLAVGFLLQLLAVLPAKPQSS
jgi:hypothetical protein